MALKISKLTIEDEDYNVVYSLRDCNAPEGLRHALEFCNSKDNIKRSFWEKLDEDLKKYLNM